MRRNVMKIIRKNWDTIPSTYDLSSLEMKDILEYSIRKEKNRGISRIYTILHCAFCAGFVLGSRATLKGVFKERK